MTDLTQTRSAIVGNEDERFAGAPANWFGWDRDDLPAGCEFTLTEDDASDYLFEQERDDEEV